MIITSVFMYPGDAFSHPPSKRKGKVLWSIDTLRYRHSQTFKCEISQDPHLVYRMDLFQANHRFSAESSHIVKHDVSRLLCFLQLGGDWRYRNQRAVIVANIVGEDQHGPCSALLTPFEWIQICQINITTMTHISSRHPSSKLYREGSLLAGPVVNQYHLVEIFLIAREVVTHGPPVAVDLQRIYGTKSLYSAFRIKLTIV